MKLRHVPGWTYALVSLLPVIDSAMGQSRASDAPAAPSEASAPRAHDSDLDAVLVNGARISDLPLLTQPILETPQTITTIAEEVIQLQAASDLREVLRNDPSVSAHADEDNAQGTNVQIRGFSARYDMYLDGQLDFGSYYRDPFNLEQVQVLTGPSSVLFGRGSTGGAIEQVSKKPQTDEFADGTASIGTDRLKRITADVNVPVQDGAAARVTGMAQEGGVAGRDVVGTKRIGIAPSLALGMNSTTQLTISYLYQGQWDKPDYGVPWVDIGPVTNISHPAAVPPDNFYGFPSDYSRVSVNILTATLRSQLADNVSLRNQIRYGVYDQNYREAEPGVGPVIASGAPLSSVTVTRTERGGRAHQTFLDDQLSVNATFETVGVKHTVVAGAEAGRQVSDPTVLKFAGVASTNLITPDEGQGFSGTAAPSSIVHFTAQTQALFATDTVRLGERWELNGAARLDRFASDYRNQVPTLVTLEHTDVIASWRAAIVYKPIPDVSVYGMYGTSFDPSAEGLSLSAATADLAPERSHTVETGIKWDPNRYLLVSGALFRTVMSNLREVSPIDPTIQILAGTARSQGVEIQAQGYVATGWLALAGFTYMDASILSSPNGDRGSQLQDAPRENLRLFSAYDLTSKLTIGGGVDYTSSRVPGTVVDPNGFRQEVPGYWSASVLARYRIASRINLQLNVDNIANRRYYDGVDDNHVNLGAGRSARLSFIVQK
jgi:catecholate siderophore receptor